MSDFYNYSVRSREEAEEVIQSLLVEYASDTAWEKFTNEARSQKRSTAAYVRRTVRNLLRSGKPRR